MTMVLLPRHRSRSTEQDLQKAQAVDDVREIALVLVARLRNAAARLEKALEEPGDPDGGE